MKKFTWRLQCVLDTKAAEEKNKQIELHRTNKAVADKHCEITANELKLKKSISEVQKLEGADRLEKQQILISYANSANKHIRKLEEELKHLMEEQKRKVDELVNIRKYREGLEKLKEKARHEYIYEAARKEQKEIDDYVSISYARDNMENDAESFDYF